MGDLVGDSGGQSAVFVPPSEVGRVLGANGDPTELVAAFATAARINALSMIHLAGSGHIGSSFSSLDVVSWLFLRHLDDDDVYFSSKGHDVPGLYAVLLGLGRLDWGLRRQLRRLGGLPGHPDIGTPGIAFNTGSLGMGISKAKGLIWADRLAGRHRKVVVMTGDGELQEGQIWESLATAVRDRMTELTVVVDHNRLQSDLPVANVSDLGDLEAKFRAFGWTVATCDGHDSASLSETFSTPRDGPLVVIAITVKGSGSAHLEHTKRPDDERFYPFHSGALGDELYGRVLDELRDRLIAQFSALGLGVPEWEQVEREADGQSSDPGKVHKLVHAYGKALAEAGRQHDEVVVLDADLMVDLGLLEFRDRFPDRFIECGIAEQDMVSQAGGLAAGGMLPFVHSFGSFLSARPREQILNNASEGRTVVYMGALGGVLPAGPGHSHQATHDIASFSAVPGMTVIAPSTEQQVADAVALAASGELGATYLRLCSLPSAVPFADDALPERGTGRTVHQGDGQLVVIGYGPVLLTEAWYAITGDEVLAKAATLIDLPWLTDVDETWLRRALGEASSVTVLDDHHVVGALSDRIGALLAGSALVVARLGVSDLPECGRPHEVLAHHGLDRRSLREHLTDLATRVPR